MPKLSISDRLPLLHAESEPRIPQLGFGVYKSAPEQTVASCLAALEAGYRHIDTAQYYGNEAEVGEAVRRSPHVRRGDVFLTTKIMEPAASGSLEETFQSCLESVRKLDDGSDGNEGGKGYVDLFLIHSAFALEMSEAEMDKLGMSDADRKASRRDAADKRKLLWHALERLYNEGWARSIGVSNFAKQHIEELAGSSQLLPPAVNQIEIHPWCQQKGIVQWCKERNIVVEAYCPIARNQKGDDATVRGVAEKHGVTPNQVLIRWALQRGLVPLPKSDNPERIRANADVYGFDLDAGDMEKLDGLDRGARGALVRVVQDDQGNVAPKDPPPPPSSEGTKDDGLFEVPLQQVGLGNNVVVA